MEASLLQGRTLGQNRHDGVDGGQTALRISAGQGPEGSTPALKGRAPRAGRAQETAA